MDIEPKARTSFEDLYLRHALGLAERSTCRRLSVGCVITSADYRYVFGAGYNGNAVGLANECDSAEPGACGCIHSEANAIVNCRAGRDEAKVVFVTHSPCRMCAKLLINLGGVQRVVYGESYRSPVGLDILQDSGIVTCQWISSLEKEKCRRP